jgi:hypothetical protein
VLIHRNRYRLLGDTSARPGYTSDHLQDARADAERAQTLSDPGDYILDLQVYNLLVQIYTRLGDREAVQKYVLLSESANIPIKASERK